MGINNLTEVLSDPDIHTLAIAGHVRPDGDCVGSTTALYQYVQKYYPQIQADLYLEPFSPVFSYIGCLKDAKGEAEKEKIYDLFITCDVSTRDRIAVAGSCFDRAKKTVCIDHHISNPAFAQVNHIRGEIGSCAEVLYRLMDPEKIDKEIAVSLFTGMVHDTGVFQYANTTPETMCIAGELMKRGIDFSGIIETSFYQKTYIQNQVLGRVLTESILLCGGRVISGCMKKKDMDFYGIDGRDLEGIVQQLRLTKGVEAAIFLYELQTQTFKVSLRSNGSVNVNEVATLFGGGGHERAAGCTMEGNMYDVINNLTKPIVEQLEKETCR